MSKKKSWSREDFLFYHDIKSRNHKGKGGLVKI